MTEDFTTSLQLERERRIRAESYLEGYRAAMQEVLSLCVAPKLERGDGAWPTRRLVTPKPEALAAARLRTGGPKSEDLPPGVELPPATVEAIPPEEFPEPELQMRPEYSFTLRLRTPEERAQFEAQRREEDRARREAEEERRRQRARRWVYFIQEGEAGPVKIGFSQDVQRRLGELQRMARGPLRLLVSFEGTRRDEATLHERFAAHRLNGEWFHPAEEILAHVTSLQLEKRG